MVFLCTAHNGLRLFPNAHSSDAPTFSRYISSIIIDEYLFDIMWKYSGMNVQIRLQKGIQCIASSTSTARLLIFVKIPESPKFLVRFYILGSTGLVAQFSICVNFASTGLYFTLKNEFNPCLLRLKMILLSMMSIYIWRASLVERMFWLVRRRLLDMPCDNIITWDM